MPKLLQLLLIGSGLVLGCGLAALVAMKLTVDGATGRAVAAAIDPLTPKLGFEGMKIPEFAGVTQEGKPADQTIFDGRVTVLSFIFTHCPLACPAMTSTVKGISDELKGTSVRFVTLALDPANDTPARLKDWAENYKADLTRWTFINAGAGTHERILREVFKEHLDVDPGFRIALEDGTTMDNIVHPTAIYLIGPDRGMIDRFASKRAEEVTALVERARIAAASLGRGK